MAKRMSPNDRVKLVWSLLLFKTDNSRENWVTKDEVREMIIDTGVRPSSNSTITKVLEALEEYVLEPAAALNTIGNAEKVIAYKVKEMYEWQTK